MTRILPGDSTLTTRFSRLGLAAVATLAMAWPTLGCANPGEEDAAAKEPAKSAFVSIDAAPGDFPAAALTALRDNEPDRVRELAVQTAERADAAGDAELGQLAAWVTDFEAQREKFAAERTEDYEKQVERVQRLEEAGFVDYAVRFADSASALADDKEAFAELDWVQNLMTEAAGQAANYEAEQQWAKAFNIYASLSSIEPYNARWHDAFENTSHRLRLLSLYAPDRLDAVRDAEQERAEAVEEILAELDPDLAEDDEPTTQPSTQPADEDVDEAEDEDNPFATDWRDALRDVNMRMLQDALQIANERYRVQISYRELLTGGLDAAEALVTTNGLETTFPGLADEEKAGNFLGAVEQLKDSVTRPGIAIDARFARRLLMVLQDANERSVDLPEEVLVSAFANGVMSHLDPYSSMIWPEDIAEFSKATQGNFSGVGISIRNDPSGDLMVVSPLEDSPAYDAGIIARDVITHIDGKNARGITTQQAVSSITGPAGTDVTLTVERIVDGKTETRDFTLTRSKIVVKSVKGWRHLTGGGWEYLLDDESKIGYVRIASFTPTTGRELADAVAELQRQGGQGVILDLRNNPGGVLTAARDVSDLFLKEGTIVSTASDRDKRDRSELNARRQRNDVTLPVAVLVNEGSASASEIVSGALKDLDRATIIGQRTFGKGSVQMVMPVDGQRAQFKLTTRHYYLPSGRSIHRDKTDHEWGVDPDLAFPLTPTQMLAAIEARQALEVLRKDAPPLPPEEVESLREELLAKDPQLNAALLVLRLQLAEPPADPAAGGVARK
jgi:carboxyl-terminal processing protease